MLVVPPDAVRVFERIQPRLVAEAVVRTAERDQLFGALLVDGGALALDIRAAVPAHAGAFVADDARLGKRFINDAHRVLYIAAAVCVFDAQNELSARFFCEKVPVQRRTQVADVHIPRGAGRKARSYFFHALPPFFSVSFPGSRSSLPLQ